MRKNNKQHALVPRLRFPEFRDQPGWRTFTLIDLADPSIKWSFIGGPFGSNLKASDFTDTGVRIIQLQNIGDGEFLNDYKIYTSRDKADELLSCNAYPGEIILSKMGDPVGRACIAPPSEPRYLMSSDGIRLVVDQMQFDKMFVFLSINSGSFRRRVKAAATGSTRKRIGLDTLRQLAVEIPVLAEQRKIADCLGSLDDLIAAEGRKLAALKDHKKGLIQQLFPRDGETRPRLRFPEFKSSPEWKRSLLERLVDERRIELGRGKVISHDDMRANPGPYPVYSSSVIDNGLMGKYGDYLFDEEMISWSVDGGGHFFYRPKHKYSVTNVSGFMRVLSDDIVCRFLAYQLQRLHASETFNYVQKAHPSVIRTLYTVGLPDPNEQHRISDCLSALDAIITAVAEKVDVLRTHKRGLMQELFPVPGDAEA